MQQQNNLFVLLQFSEMAHIIQQNALQRNALQKNVPILPQLLNFQMNQGKLKRIIREANNHIQKQTFNNLCHSINSQSKKQKSLCQNYTFSLIYHLFQRKINFFIQIFQDTQHLKVTFNYQKVYYHQYFNNSDTITNDISCFMNNEKQNDFPCKSYIQYDLNRFQFTFFHVAKTSDTNIKNILISSLLNFIQIDKTLNIKFGKNLDKIKKQNEAIEAQNKKVSQIKLKNYQKNFSIEKKILHYRMWLDKNKKNNLNDHILEKQKQILQLFYKKKFLQTQLRNEYKTNQKSINSYIKQIQKQIDRQIQKENQQDNFIAQSIYIINKQSQDFKPFKKQYPNLFNLKCWYKPVITCNGHLNLQKPNNSDNNINSELINLSLSNYRLNLIAKQKKGNDNKFVKSFQNELKFIYNHRGKKCKSLAKYYLEQQTQLKSNYWKEKQYIYIQKYQISLEQRKQYFSEKIDKLIKFMYDVMKGLKFLYQNDLLHHDIKPSNIMIDRQQNPKIIDFEGVRHHNKIKNNNKNQNDCYETSIDVHSKGYYIEYQQSDESIKKNYKQQYNEHALYDMYSYGITFQFIKKFLDFKENEKQQYLSCLIKDFLLRCTHSDPEMRITPKEGLTYLYLIQKKIQDFQKNKSQIQNQIVNSSVFEKAN